MGAGLTGALFLGALRRLEKSGTERRFDATRKKSPETTTPRSRLAAVGRWSIILPATLLIALAGHALWLQPQGRQPLAFAVRTHLPAAGTANPVTAVLLNFRGHDTLLEVTVLFLAVIAVWSLDVSRKTGLRLPASPVFSAFVKQIIPVVTVFAAYLLWAGATRPGGAFQAGAMLAAGGILLFLHDHSLYFTRSSGMVRVALGFGPAFFLVVACLPMLHGRAFLHYPATGAGVLILLIEAAAALSIAVGLFALFAQARPGEHKPDVEK